MPPVDIAAPELELWGKMSKDEVEYEELRESLAAMRDDGTQLSARSLDYLAIEEPDARLAYVALLLLLLLLREYYCYSAAAGAAATTRVVPHSCAAQPARSTTHSPFLPGTWRRCEKCR